MRHDDNIAKFPVSRLFKKEVPTLVRNILPRRSKSTISEWRKTKLSFFVQRDAKIELIHDMHSEVSMTLHKTHREVKTPQISAKFLADYMAASETARRTILRNSRYQPIGRIVQHDEAKMSISKFLRIRDSDLSILNEQVQSIRDRMADSDFDRDTMDHNADYIETFAKNFGQLSLPKGEMLPPGATPAFSLHGLKVKIELQARIRRIDKSNRARTGALMLRYAKNKILAAEVAAWQSSLLLGYLKANEANTDVLPDSKLCVTLDVVGGVCHPAPSDAVRRFQNIQAACATISEGWNNIAPPHDANL